MVPKRAKTIVADDNTTDSGSSETRIPGTVDTVDPDEVEQERKAVSMAVNKLSSLALAPQSSGNKYHILALSLALRRPIFIYKSCQDPAGLYYYMKKGVADLQKAFREGLEGTEQHIRYDM